MRKRTRTILFFSLFSIFILFAPAVVLYSQGYRFDFEKRKITQTGGIFLKVEPKQTEIYINNKLIKKTDFFFGSALLENLLPGEYKIKLKKDGYYLWEKNLEVKEKQVTEAKNIILVPGKVDFTVLAKNIQNFWISPDGKKAALLEKNLPPQTSWALKLYDLEKNVKSHLIEEKADLLNLEWSNDSKEIYLNAAEENFVLRLDKLPPTLTKRAPVSTAVNSTSTDIISLDKKRSVVFSASEIWIFYLTDAPTKKAGEQQFLLRLSEKIKDVFWLNNFYLIFNSGDKIKIAETDDRDKIQIWEIGNFLSPQIFFNNTDKKLYILSQGNLFASENLIK